MNERSPDDGQPPAGREEPKVSPPPSAAAGIHSVTDAMGTGLRQMGAARSLKTLSNLNQFEGFDCPSCAWPDPDDRRKMAEFCENGAKAVASEATRARAGPEFFARHSIDELAAQWRVERTFHPTLPRARAAELMANWERAVRQVVAA